MSTILVSWINIHQFLVTHIIFIGIMVENQIVKKQEIIEILVKKEGLIAVLPRGRMVVKRPREIKTEQEKLADALERVYKELGSEKADSMKAKLGKI